MSKTERKIRLSQVVSNFGVGAVYDILGESLVLKDTRVWENRHYNGRGKEIKADRLVKYLSSTGLNVQKLFEPSKAVGFKKKSKGILPYMRFPKWLFCSKCRRMFKWRQRDEESGNPPSCTHCSKSPKLTPMRFIMICDHGHMSDIDWRKWAHSQTTSDEQKTCEVEDLEFLTGHSKTGGLESVAVRCRQCSASRNLGSLTSPNILFTANIYCSGGQPWESTYDKASCKRPIHAVQRGAGNVYFPIIKSAITIPPESFYIPQTTSKGRTDEITSDPWFSLLQNSRNNEAFFNHLLEQLRSKLNCSKSEIMDVLDGKKDGIYDGSDIESEEWHALVTPNEEVDDRDKFVTRHYSVSTITHSPNLRQLMDNIVSVIKLREVRAMAGFYRYQPGATDEKNTESKPVLPDLGKGANWLPALEIYGEGIFISFDKAHMQKWENQPNVLARVKKIKQRVDKSTYSSLLPTATPRFILLHTLSHLLIRRLAFECGYASASLRERIYSREDPNGNDMAGILIYTAAGDSEGTLGGLARQADPETLALIFLSALKDAANCSADPICLESSGQGLDALNMAACHACSLVAETSCTTYNLLLDRLLVVGDGVTPGFFEEVLNGIFETSANSQIHR